MKKIENPFVRDLVFLLKEKNHESKNIVNPDDFEAGQQIAYRDVLSLIYQQALAFDIDLADIGMDDYDPE